jgi:Kdo2-lipid IVA lauroyltransferase/acyltransferase
MNAFARMRYFGQAIFVVGLYRLLGLLPLDVASAIGGAIGRTVGPLLPLTRRARRNLERFMPELGADGIEAAIVEMWDNLGRTAAEYPHLHKFAIDGADARIVATGGEHIDAAKQAGRPIIFYAGHLANWEMGTVTAAGFGTRVMLVYREANNPYVEKLFHAGRGAISAGLIPKGKKGAKLAIEALKAGKALGMLLDQKMNDGVAVPFFGVPAMTAPAVGALALRFDCALLPVRIERLGRAARFAVTVGAPMDFASLPGDDEKARQMAILATINNDLEKWIRARPGQWLWLHRRWPDA